jgi:alanine dehydrogenase
MLSSTVSLGNRSYRARLGWIGGDLQGNLAKHETKFPSQTYLSVWGVERGGSVRIGVVRELVPGESRVALTPHAVHELTRAGHRVRVEADAGTQSALSNEEYEGAGAKLTRDPEIVWRDSELVPKVYGPVPGEYGYLREGLVLMAFLSLSINHCLLEALLDSRCAAFSAETVQNERGALPILKPMSEIAGSLVLR